MVFVGRRELVVVIWRFGGAGVCGGGNLGFPGLRGLA